MRGRRGAGLATAPPFPSHDWVLRDVTSFRSKISGSGKQGYRQRGGKPVA